MLSGLFKISFIVFVFFNVTDSNLADRKEIVDASNKVMDVISDVVITQVKDSFCTVSTEEVTPLLKKSDVRDI